MPDHELTIEEIRSPENLKMLWELAHTRVKDSMSSDIERAKHERVRKTGNFMKMQAGHGEYEGVYGYVAPLYWAMARNDISSYRVAFNTNPFVTVSPTNMTPTENSVAMQKMVNWNIIDTDHRVFVNNAFASVGQHGTAILKHYFMFEPKKVPDPASVVPGEASNKMIEVFIGNDYTREVNICNYLQDTSCTGNDFNIDGCKWVCELDAYTLWDVHDLMKSKDSIKENCKELINRILSSPSGISQGNISEKSRNSTEMYGDSYKIPTMNGADIDFTRKTVSYDMWGTAEIKGNENSRKYYRMIFSETIRKPLYIAEVSCHPYTIMKAIERKDCYLGRANAEASGSNQLLTTTIMNKGIENVLADMQRYFYYVKDLFNPEDIRYLPNGAFVPTDIHKFGMRNIRDALQEFQSRDLSVNGMNNILGILNNHREIATSQSDAYNYGVNNISNPGAMPGNYKATTSNIIEQNRSLPMNDMYNQLAYNLEQHWEKKITSIQENSSDYTITRVTGKEPELVRKFTLTGSFDAHVRSGIASNKSMKLQVMQGFWNFMATVLPVAQATGQLNDFNYREFVRDAMELSELPDKDMILPQQQATRQLLPAQEGMEQNIQLAS